MSETKKIIATSGRHYVVATMDEERRVNAEFEHGYFNTYRDAQTYIDQLTAQAEIAEITPVQANGDDPNDEPVVEKPAKQPRGKKKRTTEDVKPENVPDSAE